jgi:general secretion pathway protein H
MVSSRGFSLLELLLVLALAMLVLSIALARTAGTPVRSAHGELDRLRAMVELASEQAILRGEEIGIGFETDRYRFFERVHAAWLPLDAPRAYRVHSLAPGLSVQLRVEGAPVVLPDELDTPQVVIWSSGELTPFIVTLRGDGQGNELVAGADGSVSLRSGVRGR